MRTMKRIRITRDLEGNDKNEQKKQFEMYGNSNSSNSRQPCSAVHLKKQQHRFFRFLYPRESIVGHCQLCLLRKGLSVLKREPR